MRRPIRPRTPLPPTLRALLLATPLLLAACRGGEPERLTDPNAIAERVVERAREDFDGVRDFIVSGGGFTIYFRRTGPDSLVTFEYRAFADEGGEAGGPGRRVASPYVPPNTTRLAEGLRTGARLLGVASEGGDALYVLDALDPAAFAGVEAGEGPDSIRVLVDANTFRIRGLRLVVPSASVNPDAPPDAAPVVQRQLYSDFRTTHGLSLPFRMTTVVEGMIIPPDQRMLQGGVLGAQRQRAEQLPPGEREPALAEIDRQLRLLRTGVLEEPFTVEAVRVNEGIPEGIFPTPVAGRSGGER